MQLIDFSNLIKDATPKAEFHNRKIYYFFVNNTHPVKLFCYFFVGNIQSKEVFLCCRQSRPRSSDTVTEA